MDLGTLIAGLAIAGAIAWGLNKLAEALGLRPAPAAPPPATRGPQSKVAVDAADLPTGYALCGAGACPDEPEFRYYDEFYYWRCPDKPPAEGGCAGHGNCGCYLIRRHSIPTSPDQKKWQILARPGEGVGSTAVGGDTYVFRCICLRWTGRPEDEPKSIGETDRTAAAIWIRFPENLDKP